MEVAGDARQPRPGGRCQAGAAMRAKRRKYGSSVAARRRRGASTAGGSRAAGTAAPQPRGEACERARRAGTAATGHARRTHGSISGERCRTGTGHQSTHVNRRTAAARAHTDPRPQPLPHRRAHERRAPRRAVRAAAARRADSGRCAGAVPGVGEGLIVTRPRSIVFIAIGDCRNGAGYGAAACAVAACAAVRPHQAEVSPGRMCRATQHRAAGVVQARAGLWHRSYASSLQHSISMAGSTGQHRAGLGLQGGAHQGWKLPLGQVVEAPRCQGC